MLKLRYETDEELRARVVYCVGKSGQFYAAVLRATGEELDECAELVCLSRRQIKEFSTPWAP